MGRIGFYLLFGLSVTASVQMVGVYLVFSSLIIPALASRNATRFRLAKAYAVGANEPMVRSSSWPARRSARTRSNIRRRPANIPS